MSKETAIQRIWERHWAGDSSAVTDQIRNRFAIEAFRTLRTFVTDGDRLILEAGSGTGRFCALLAHEQPFPHTMYKWLLKLLERPYQYGYEKSFTHKELVGLFQEHGLGDVELAGYYPSYGFFRLGRYSRVMNWVGRLVDKVEHEGVARRFGFEIIAKGTK